MIKGLKKQNKRLKRRYKRYRMPVIGKYIDTLTKAELGVIYFVDDTGNYNLQIQNLPTFSVPSCRIQLKLSEVKRRKLFYKKLQHYLDFSSGWYHENDVFNMGQPPLLFGLLKLRKKKVRKFILVQSATSFPDTGIVNLVAVTIDNLLYLDLLKRSKNL